MKLWTQFLREVGLDSEQGPRIILDALLGVAAAFATLILLVFAVDKHRSPELTTAACLWSSSCLRVIVFKESAGGAVDHSGVCGHSGDGGLWTLWVLAGAGHRNRCARNLRSTFAGNHESDQVANHARKYI